MNWLGDVRRAAGIVGTLLRAVPVLGCALVLSATVAGVLAVGVLLASADLVAAPGMPAAVVLAVTMLAETAAHAVTRLLAALADRRLTGVLRRTVMAAALRPAGTDHYGSPSLEAARAVGIGREPKPGATLPGVSAWWITVVRRIGALALLVTAGWWVPVVVGIAWLVASVRHGWIVTVAALAVVGHVLVAATSAHAWLVVLMLAVPAAAPDAGTSLARIRELLRSGAGLVAAKTRLTGSPDRTSRERRVALVAPDPLRLPATLAENVFLDLPCADPAEVYLASGLDELVRRLPNGPDTVLTADLRDGVDLGPDDWHRIALARALVRVTHGATRLVAAADDQDARRVIECARRIAPGLIVTHGEAEH